MLGDALASHIAQVTVSNGPFDFVGANLDQELDVDWGGNTVPPGTRRALPCPRAARLPLWHRQGSIGAFANDSGIVYRLNEGRGLSRLFWLTRRCPLR